MGRFLEKDGTLYSFKDDHYLSRINKDFIEILEKLGENARTKYSHLKIVEIPDDVNWMICESDCGSGEWIAEKHRTWE